MAEKSFVFCVPGDDHRVAGGCAADDKAAPRPHREHCLHCRPVFPSWDCHLQCQQGFYLVLFEKEGVFKKQAIFYFIFLCQHGIRGYSRSLAIEVLDKGVSVTCLCPDAVQTPMLTKQYSFKEAAVTFSSPQMVRKPFFLSLSDLCLMTLPHFLLCCWFDCLLAVNCG